ncbi:hypothetical protein [Deinococcus yunweiensis]|uniref:hypothetical protein n=1 Tax=Deinococcus yunweiensis TaxID=367282 RepID=UPI00398E5668
MSLPDRLPTSTQPSLLGGTLRSAVRMLLADHSSARQECVSTLQTLTDWAHGSPDAPALATLVTLPRPIALDTSLHSAAALRDAALSYREQLRQHQIALAALDGQLGALAHRLTTLQAATASRLDTLRSLQPLARQIIAARAELKATRGHQQASGLGAVWRAISGQAAAQAKTLERIERMTQTLVADYRRQAHVGEPGELPPPEALAHAIDQVSVDYADTLRHAREERRHLDLTRTELVRDMGGLEQQYARRERELSEFWADLQAIYPLPADLASWERLSAQRTEAQTLLAGWQEARERVQEYEAALAEVWSGWPVSEQNMAGIRAALARGEQQEARPVQPMGAAPPANLPLPPPASPPAQPGADGARPADAAAPDRPGPATAPTVAPRLSLPQPHLTRPPAPAPPLQFPALPGQKAARPLTPVIAQPTAHRSRPVSNPLAPAEPPRQSPLVGHLSQPPVPVEPVQQMPAITPAALPPVVAPAPPVPAPVPSVVAPPLPQPSTKSVRPPAPDGPPHPLPPTPRIRVPMPGALVPDGSPGPREGVTPERLTQRERARREAVRIVDRYGWARGFVQLADHLDRANWGQLRTRIEAEIQAGMTPEEFELVLLMRAYWHDQTHFQAAHTARYDSMPWSLALRLIRQSAGVPCIDEMTMLIERFYDYACHTPYRNMPAFAQRLGAILETADPDVDLDYWLGAQEARCYSR